MHVAVYGTIVVAVLIAPTGRLGARCLAPRAAAITLVAVAACAAAGWLWGLSLLAATLVNIVPGDGVGVVGFHMAQDPVPAWVGLIAALLLGAAGARVVEAGIAEVRSLMVQRAMVRACRSAAGELVVIADAAPRAFAVPSVLDPPGWVVVSTGMLGALDAEERAVLLAHEQSHLRNRHSWLRRALTLAHAVDPLLRGTAAQMDAALERWADEDAVRAASSRQVAARSVGRAALATLRRGAVNVPTPRVIRRSGGVPARVVALRGEAPRSRWLPTLALAALFLVLLASTAEASHDLETLFDPGSPSSTS